MSALLWKNRSPWKGPLRGTRSNGPREQAETHVTPDFLPLSRTKEICLKKEAACAGRRKVTRNFESVLVIDNAPIRLCAATMVARPCEFPERADRASGLPPRVHQIVMFARGSTLKVLARGEYPRFTEQCGDRARSCLKSPQWPKATHIATIAEGLPVRGEGPRRKGVSCVTGLT